MARILNAETRERHAVADRSIETCCDLLSNPDIQNATNGLAVKALDLIKLLYVPNESDGIFDISKGPQRMEGIPFIPMLRGEKKRVRQPIDYVIHPGQREGIRLAINEIEHKDLVDTDKEFNKAIKWINETCIEFHGEVIKTPTSTLKNFEALVLRLTSGIGLEDKPNSKKTSEYHVETRPMLFANVDALESDEGAIMFHELIHVGQYLRGAVYKPGKKRNLEYKRNELEAYSGQVVAEEIHHGVTANDNPNGWNSMAIEALRRKHNADSDDPYLVTKQLLKEIKDGGWSIN